MLKSIFSMKVAVLLLFIFGITLGVATFIENDYGTQTAKSLVYNAKWFELFLFYFIATLLYNIIKFKSYKNRLPVFIFHISFLVIAIGAILTRYVGYEGIMHIREGESSNTMVSDVQMLNLSLTDGKTTKDYEKKLYLSSMTKNHISETFTIGNKKVRVELVDYKPNAQRAIVDDPNGKKILEFKLVGSNSRGKIVPLSSGESYDAGNFILSYNKDIQSSKPIFEVTDSNGTLYVKTSYDMSYLKMDDRSQGELKAGTNRLEKRHLYRFGESAVVLKSIHERGKVDYISTGLKAMSRKPELIKLKISVKDSSETITLLGRKGVVGEPTKTKVDGIEVTARYGAKIIKIPFYIKLVKFDLERYPGSMTPSSYASDVVLIDKEQNIEQPFRIYMNHVLDHRNYRFFQSSYDTDEKGTILSVNHDPGTLPTYIGYLLLTIGMIWSLFIEKGRFQKLLKGARKYQNHSAIIVAIFALFATSSPLHSATITVDENIKNIITKYDKDHAQKFGHLVMQDHQGRMKPIDTLAQEVVSKLSGKSSILGLTHDQIILGMTTKPDIYQEIAMIKIGHPKIALKLGLSKDDKYAKFSDFFTKKDNNYKLYKDVTIASRKKPLEKSQYDKELIKIDERINVAYMVYTGSLLKIYPKPKDKNNKWLSPVEAIKSFPGKESQMVQLITLSYFQSVDEGIKSGDWSKADEALDVIAKYQKFYGGAVIPSDNHIDMEIKYNNLGLFGKLVPLYLLLGIALLLFAFANVLKPSLNIKWVMRVSWSILILGFMLHVIGMGIRWYISGHAPWSNAYESIVFIAASTVVAGLILAKNSPFALAGSALLAGITMGVAHMNFINPEITNLVPVLKSYWLMIHVATIISGDGFLGLGSILSLFVLILFIIRGKGKENIDRSIKELTNLAEMSLIIGLMLMTIGNFLGGVWANESWGRYWGWDPKETWAAVTILIYATVLHLRFIPKLKSIYIFNIASVWAYSSVLMTYFGVNYYLSGLHSYAAGDPIPFPMWAWYSIAGLLVLSILAARNRKLK
ncbi:Putative cytochrome C-type biogenesis protein [hydrothermal vent metagenome]|uniref:Putative cytochrome C-type biogenesis protein n=1 Tax=hydrothermal vent metagenome TaxID=652676 RepID=A0A1W1C3U5_9ZZZZ